ncbi:MAG: sugar phosphate isomerase/epimerase [Firmicutes bacterium]|nr:sugar phosphate isomerase/epimerase [Bacillota bacterium]
MAHFGLQLYTLRDRMQQDFLGTLQQVAEIGYEGVEFAGFGGLSATDLRAALDRLGLRGVSAHIPLAQLDQVDEITEYAKVVGLEYVVCPWLDPSMRDNYSDLMKQLGELGAKYAERGLSLCYHNHDFEFAVKVGDRYAFDYLFANTNPKHVQVELDAYWVHRAGFTATDYLERYKGRTPLLHLKDMRGDESKAFAELGQGTLPIRSFIEEGVKNGVSWFFVEQDVCPGDALDSVKTSFRHLRDLGFVK